jgi:hypothetical protein
MPNLPPGMSQMLWIKLENMLNRYKSLAHAFTAKNDLAFNEAIA